MANSNSQTLENLSYVSTPGLYLPILDNTNQQQDMECAQIKVVGGSGTGQPSPMAKIPGIYSASDPAMTYNFWGSGGNYVMPGPAVWSG